MPSGSEETHRRFWEKQKAVVVVLTVAKWLVVLWLLLPIHKPLHGLADFSRVTLGIFLFIVFSTKLLYDRVIQGGLRRRDTSAEVWQMIGLLLAITLIVGVVVIFVGMLLVTLIKSASAPGSF